MFVQYYGERRLPAHLRRERRFLVMNHLLSNSAVVLGGMHLADQMATSGKVLRF